MKGISKDMLRCTESQLRAAIGNVEECKINAEAYKEDRTEKWCESDAGEEYENKIERLNDLLDILEDAVSEFLDIVEGD